MSQTGTGFWDTLKAKAEAFLATAEAAVVAEWDKIEPVLEHDLETAFSLFGDLAMSLIANYLGEAGVGMSGLEKNKSVSLRLQEHAVGQGKTLPFSTATSVTQRAFDGMRLARGAKK